ncbi:MAG: hypothetical protein HOM11_09495 [Methylococcales bacterium]|nr:hypothetical protein [Methylococcales bacterium]MBT7444468.1 hypothetical protein [Methylococcales bacterium]
MKISVITQAALVVAIASCGMPQLALAGFLDDLGDAIVEGVEEGLSEDYDDGYEAQQPAYSVSPNRSRRGWNSGDRVIGQWSNGEWYPATVESPRKHGYYLIFDDGDTAVVTAKQIHPFNWRKGSRVQCKWQNGSRYYSGVIARINGRSLNINYDDGDREKTKTRACRDANGLVANGSSYAKPPVKRKRAAAPVYHSNGFRRGSRVVGQWTNGAWYPATVQWVKGGRYHLKFDDGDQLTVRSHKLAAFNWRRGSRVQCNYQLAGTYYSGVISHINGSSLSISYDQGGSERTYVKRCRSSSAGGSTAYGRQVQSIRNSASDVPDDPADFLRAIERNSQ